MDGFAYFIHEQPLPLIAATIMVAPSPGREPWA